MIVSQPRRIAAKALAERVRSSEPDIADQIGLRSKSCEDSHCNYHFMFWFISHHDPLCLSIRQWAMESRSMNRRRRGPGLLRQDMLFASSPITPAGSIPM